MNNTIFEIVAKNITNKRFQKTAFSLAKTYKPTIALELERAMNLSIDLYFEKNEVETLQICEYLAEIQFDGNANIWTWVQATLLLQTWIYKQQNNEQKVEQLVSLIAETFTIKTKNELADSIRIKVRDRTLKGTLLNYEEIQNAINSKDIDSEIAYRKTHFIKLLYIYFLGGSDEFSISRALIELEENNRIIIEKL